MRGSLLADKAPNVVRQSSTCARREHSVLLALPHRPTWPRERRTCEKVSPDEERKHTDKDECAQSAKHHHHRRRAAPACASPATGRVAVAFRTAAEWMRLWRSCNRAAFVVNRARLTSRRHLAVVVAATGEQLRHVVKHTDWHSQTKAALHDIARVHKIIARVHKIGTAVRSIQSSRAMASGDRAHPRQRRSASR